MKKQRLSFYFFFFIFIFTSFDILAQNGQVKGKILNSKNNEPVPFASIIIDGKPQFGTTSDIDGNFTLSGITPGYVKLVVSSLGYEKKLTEDILVTNSKHVYIEVLMQETVVTLKQVEIKALPFARKDEYPVSLQTLNVAEIERNPGSNRDISKVLQSLPGVASTPAYRNDVIVRGGGSAENRFYLDGIEIPNLNHFATQGSSGGAVGIINVDFIREVEFYSGAFPASRGNALSSVIDFRQKDGNKDKLSVRGTLGASDLALTLDGPVSKNSTFIFSLRRSYLQFLFSVIGLPFLPTYNDMQFKYKINLNTNNQVSIISLGALDDNKLNTGIKNPTERQRYILGYLPVNQQWNYTFGIVYRHFRKNGADTWVLSRNMLDNRAYKYLGNIEIDTNKLLDYNSQEIENKFRYERTFEKNDWKISFGVGGEYAKYNNSTYQKTFSGGMPRVIDYSSSLDMFKWSSFGQVTHPLLNDRLTLSLGARMDGNNYNAEMSDFTKQLSPRFSASYSLNEKYFLNFNMGRYFQLPPYTSLGFRDNSGNLVNKSNNLKYIEADHVVLGLEYLSGTQSKFTVEGFFKAYRHYPFSVKDSISLASKGADYGTVGDEEVTSQAKGRAYGAEISWRNKDLYGFNLILSYTLVRSEFTDYKGKYIPSAWDNKHLFNITLSRSLKHNWDVGLKWRFVGGAPYTPYDLNKSSLVSAWDAQGRGYLDYSMFNQLRLNSFHQLDIRIDKEYYFKNWSLMFYLDIQNVYNFKADSPSDLYNIQPDGSIVKYVDDQGNNRYKLRLVDNYSGTILPTIGIMIEF